MVVKMHGKVYISVGCDTEKKERKRGIALVKEVEKDKEHGSGGGGGSSCILGDQKGGIISEMMRIPSIGPILSAVPLFHANCEPLFHVTGQCIPPLI